MPTKYDAVKSKFMDIKKTENQNQDPMNIISNLKPDDPMAIEFKKIKEKINRKKKPNFKNRRVTIDTVDSRYSYIKRELQEIREIPRSESPEPIGSFDSPTIQNIKTLNNSLEFTGYAGLNPELSSEASFKVNLIKYKV